MVSPRGDLGYYPHFVDEEGIYYTTHQGAFGKVDKVNGQILWEFDLIDEKGEKQKAFGLVTIGKWQFSLAGDVKSSKWRPHLRFESK